jgi:hypothetical protein
MSNIPEKYTKNGVAEDIEYATQKVAEALNALDVARSTLKRVEHKAPEWDMEVRYNTEEASTELAYVLAALVTWWDMTVEEFTED